MPFGLINAPAIFTVMMYNFKQLWDESCITYELPIDRSKNTTMIVDDVFYFGTSEDNMFILLEYICKIARKYNLLWKLKKCEWLPKKFEFVGVDISVDDNMPSASKFGMLNAWKYPSTSREFMDFIRFTIFYFKWIPYFETKVSLLRNLIKSCSLDSKFPEGIFDATHKSASGIVKQYILRAPVL